MTAPRRRRPMAIRSIDAVEELSLDDIRTMVDRLDRPFLPAIDGNLGDALIRWATFDRLGLPPDIGRRSRRARSILFPGGGNLVPFYAEGSTLLRRLPEDREGVILPHSIRGASSLLRRHPGVIAIARERATVDHLLAGGVPATQVRLADDLAFSLAGDVPTPPGQGSGTLLALRIDAESRVPDLAHREHNFDVSEQRVAAWTDPDETRDWARASLRFVALYDRVVTDRLHVAIAAALVGRDCWLLPNLYDKNRAVHDHSIRDRFPHVVWCEDVSEVPRDVLAGVLPGAEHRDRWMHCRPEGDSHRTPPRAALAPGMRRAVESLPPPIGRSRPLPVRTSSPRLWLRARRLAPTTVAGCSRLDRLVLADAVGRRRAERALESVLVVRRDRTTGTVRVIDVDGEVGDEEPRASNLGDLLHDLLETREVRSVFVVGTRTERTAMDAVVDVVDSLPWLDVRVATDAVLLETDGGATTRRRSDGPR